MVTQISALIDSSAGACGGKGWFLFLIQDRSGEPTRAQTHTSAHMQETWCQAQSVNRNSRATNQHTLFSKLQGKLECESRMKGWSADRAAERGRSFSPDYRTATDYRLWIIRVWPKKKKKLRQRDKQAAFSVSFSECVCVCVCVGFCLRLCAPSCCLVSVYLSDAPVKDQGYRKHTHLHIHTITDA